MVVNNTSVWPSILKCFGAAKYICTSPMVLPCRFPTLSMLCKFNYDNSRAWCLDHTKTRPHTRLATYMHMHQIWPTPYSCLRWPTAYTHKYVNLRVCAHNHVYKSDCSTVHCDVADKNPYPLLVVACVNTRLEQLSPNESASEILANNKSIATKSAQFPSMAKYIRLIVSFWGKKRWMQPFQVRTVNSMHSVYWHWGLNDINDRVCRFHPLTGANHPKIFHVAKKSLVVSFCKLTYRT